MEAGLVALPVRYIRLTPCSQTQAPNASTNGGDASRVGKIFSYYLVEHVFSSFLYPDARRVAPIRGSVLWRGLVLEETQALMGAARPASGK